MIHECLTLGCGAEGSFQYKGLLDALRQTVKREGVAGFWSGFPAFYFLVGPHTLITLMVQDYLHLYVTSRSNTHYPRGCRLVRQSKMKKGKRGDPGAELYSQSQFVGQQHNLLDMQRYMGKQDTFPELGPLNPLPPLSFEDPRDRELSTLAETLEREVATNKMLEQKCEEYLSQLQRSADIIESSREKHELEIENLLERVEEAERRVHEERDRRRLLEEERDRARGEAERLQRDLVGAESDRDGFPENVYRKEANISELKVKIGELEHEVSSLRAELTVTKADKQRGDQETSQVRRELESIERELEMKKHELQRLDYKEEGSKSQLAQVQERLTELRSENTLLRQDKDKLFGKVDHLLYENDNLRNEVFMLKKILFEVEKREHGQSHSQLYSNQSSQSDRGRENRRLDPEVESMRNRIDRPSRSPIGQARENLGIRLPR